MEFPIKESIGAVVALTVAGLGYLQWRRTKRSGRYIEDREAAYKAVWQALEEIHLYVRTGDFDEPTFDELMKKANTLLIQQGLYISDLSFAACTRPIAQRGALRWNAFVRRLALVRSSGRVNSPGHG
jgi:hypothetical protein